MSRLEFAPKLKEIQVTDFQKGLGVFTPKPDKPVSFTALKDTLKKAGYTLDAADINFASNYLANLVRANNLTPKILIVHRYTQNMVTNYKQIKTLPEVQILMNMDGWGDEAKKINTYQQFIYKEPVQFTGFKLFYKNDILTPGTTLMTPNKLLKLSPQPIYIQYQ